MTDVLASLGWIWLVAAAGTGVVALLLGLWRVLQPARTARAEHTRAAAALLLALGVALMTPWALARSASATPQPGLAPSAPAATAAATLATTPTRALGTLAIDLGVVARTVGVFWLVTMGWIAIRITGGWWVVRGLLARSRAVSSRPVSEMTSRLSDAMRVSTPAAVRLSNDIDVPVVAGVRPVILLPASLERASDAVLRPLLAHELAHVARRDYAANLLQSIADIILFALPGARWVSARVRETREFACDEMAVQVTGDVPTYVRALTSAATGLSRPLAAAVGADGPRLERRVDRLLNGPRLSRHRVALAACAVVSAAIAGHATVSALQLAPSQQPPARHQRGAFEALISWAFEQPGSGILMSRATAGAAFACDSARLQNNTNVAVTGVAFSAVVSIAGRRDSVKVLSGDLVTVSIPPGGTADVDAQVLPQSEWARMAGADARFDVMCGLGKVTFANGFFWESPPNPAAVTPGAALALIPAELPRSLIAPEGPVMSSDGCVDDRDRHYSLGAIVQVKNEPGTFARCVDETTPGDARTLRWVEYAIALRQRRLVVSATRA